MSGGAGGGDEVALLRRAVGELKELRGRVAAAERARTEPIAVVGIGCRFPGGVTDPESYWKLLREGVDAVTEIPAGRWDVNAYYNPDPDAPGKMYTRHGGFVEDVDRFDAGFFGISPREAMSMDPQQRLLLEVAWESLEHAGIAPDRLGGSRTGVFVGITTTDYSELHLARNGYTHADAYTATGNCLNFAAGRLSYVLGVNGPCMAVDAACASSLVTIHLACQALRAGECDLALAGGVNLILSPYATILLSRTRALAPDGRCKTFDAAADGMGRGEGCGIVALKRLSDALADGDRIVALVRGSAVRQDGAGGGLTVPNGLAQQELLREALERAGVKPSEVGYVEAHGTGTQLGDPIEVRALRQVFREGRNPDRPLVLGSVKTNFGHTESAAGIAGFIKAALALERGEIPPHLHLENPSPYIPWDELPFVVPREPLPWPGEGRRIAGVSSFGLSGILAHIVLEAAPARPAITPTATERPVQVLALSAKSESALREMAARYADHLGVHPEQSLADVCHTADTGRAHFAHRLALPTADATTLRTALVSFARGESSEVATGVVPPGRRPKVAFLFSGQGSPWAGMGQELCETQPTFRAALDRCAEILVPHLDRPLQEVLASEPLLTDTTYAQPALLAVEWALVETWRSFGVEPAAVLGHSVGEYVAATVAGVLTLEDALRLIAARGRLMGALPRTGAMAAVLAPVARVKAAVAAYPGQVSIAAENAPEQTVLSGERGAVEAILAALAREGVRSQRLPVSHAFHSPLLEPMLYEFEAIAAEITYRAPRLNWVSNRTARVVEAGEIDGRYWVEHARESVRFREGMAALDRLGVTAYLEVGPGSTLIGLGRRCVEDTPDRLWLPSLRRGEEWPALADSIARLYVAGAEVDWPGWDRDTPRRTVSLPTYPFQRERYWLEEREAPVAALPEETTGDVDALPGRRLRSAGQEVIFETQLSADGPGTLADHKIRGAALLPVTGYVDVMMAAAHTATGRDGWEVADLALHTALVLPAKGTVIVQCVLKAGEGGETTAQLFSLARRGVEEIWVRHATAILRAAPEAVSEDTETLEAIRVRCGDAGVEAGAACYATLASQGVEVISRGQVVEGIWRGDGEALARLRPPGIGDISLLAGCFHLLGAVLPAGTGSEGLLPVGARRAVSDATALQSGYGHVRRVERDGETELDLRLYDDAGKLVAAVEGLRLARMTSAALTADGRAPYLDWLYELTWEPVPAPPAPSDLPDPAPLADSLREPALRWGEELGLEQYALASPELERASAEYAAQALRSLGWQSQPGEIVAEVGLAERLGILAAHRRLFGRLLGMLAEEGVLRSTDSGWAAAGPLPEGDPDARLARLREQFPALEAELALLERCGPRLAEVLRGECDPVQLLFPAGSADAAERLYAESPGAVASNRLVAEAVTRALVVLPPGARLRILEVGAGTGGTTASVLPRLPADRVEYTFTDVSPLFTARASEKFAEYPFLRPRVLDLESPTAAQGFGGGQYDLVIAANVLHATADLRTTLSHIHELLAPGGLLLLLEGTCRTRWLDLIFGLTEGWWRFSDTDLRAKHPLLSVGAWSALLREQGFSAVSAVAGGDSGEEAPQALLIARRDLPEQSGAWVILADAGGVGAALADRLAAQGERSVLGSTINRELLAQVAWEEGGVRGVIHGASLDEPKTELEFPGFLSATTESALAAAQVLAGEAWAGNPRLWLLTRGAQPVGDGVVVSAAGGALWGLGRTLAQEHPEAWGGLVDLDPDDPLSAAETLSLVLNERGGEDQLAVRGGSLLGARLARREASSTTEFVARADATYLITGGYGGIGLRLARWLAERGARHLTLMSRSGPSEAARKTLERLAGLGVTAMDARGDVACEEDVSRVLTGLERPLAGVFHTAGVYEDAVLLRQDAGKLARVLAPKALGALYLHRLTRHLSLDCFVLFSSSAAVLGAPGLANYAAANAFLDSLAHLRRSEGLPALSVNWGPWSRVGMAESVGARREQEWLAAGVTPFPAEQGLAALESLVGAGATQAMVLPVEWGKVAELLSGSHAPPLLAKLLSEGQAESAEVRHSAEAGDAAVAERLLALPAPERPVFLASYLRERVGRVLRADAERVAVDRSLLEMGMDSLMAMELIGELNRSLGVTLYPREFYEHPTVATLAPYLAQEVERAQSQRSGVRSQGSEIGLKPAREMDAPATSFLTPHSSLLTSHSSTFNTLLDPAVFLLSSPRAGSTLLRVMLEGHPGLFSPPELYLLSFATMRGRQNGLGVSFVGEGLQRAVMEVLGLDAEASKARLDEWTERDLEIAEVYAELQRAAAPRLLVDKTPAYAASLDVLRRAETLFDGARYLYLVRHPYSVIESFTRMRMERLLGAGEADPFTLAEQVWTTSNGNIRRFLQEVDPSRGQVVRYEELVRDPAGVTERMCDFLGLPFDPALLDPYGGGRMTDGVHATSAPINDPNFLKHDRIDPTLADAWKRVTLPRPLSAETRELAEALGYELPGEPKIVPVARSIHAEAAPMRERTVDARGLPLAVCEWGAESEPRVLCLHGLLEHGAAWERVAAPLAAQGFCVVAPDMRGHGRSGHVGMGGSYHMIDFVADMDRVTVAWGNEPILLAGHSMGSAVAAMYAAARPERVRALVLVEPQFPKDREGGEAVGQLAAHLAHLSAPPPEHPIFPNVAAAAERLRQGAPAMSEAWSLRLAERITEPYAGGVKWRWDPMLRTRAGIGFHGTEGMSLDAYLDLLGSIQAPLTMVYGDSSVFVRAEYRRLEEQRLAARRVTLPGGHNLHVDSPEALAAVITEAAGAVR